MELVLCSMEDSFESSVSAGREAECLLYNTRTYTGEECSASDLNGDRASWLHWPSREARFDQLCL